MPSAYGSSVLITVLKSPLNNFTESTHGKKFTFNTFIRVYASRKNSEAGV